ncbi:hypothetical protein [Sediminibacterium soli]|uniref:hypothetical protein n=1 Tax=Sediminibacterium soli TaxID=2698829 RepID=UPI001379ED61|nr:hypothetical protein [Sediminibacterium soli]NCI46139.1 hypothetical protein [Sediminibacterium soli]
MKKSDQAVKAQQEAGEKETSKGKPTSTQDTGPKNQVNESLRGDDYSEEETHLDSAELRDADAESKGE